jgi:hypothetical protein
MTAAALELQKAIVAALLADTGLAALVGDRIYDAPPRNATFPYLVLDEMAMSDWSTATEGGHAHRVTLHAWSRERGKRACHEILDAAEAVLGSELPALDGHALVNLRFADAAVRRDPDGITWHGVMRLRAVTEPA